MIEIFLNKLVRMIYSFPILILLCASVMTVFAGMYATDLKIKTDIGDLLPEHTHSVQNLKRVGKRIGASGYLMVMVEGKNPVEMKRFARDLSEALMEAKKKREKTGKEALVQNVDFRNDIQYFEDHALYWLGIDELQDLWERIDDEVRSRKMKANPLFVDLDDEDPQEKQNDGDWSFEKLREKHDTGDFKEYFISDDETVLAVLVRPTGPSSDLAFGKRLLAHVREVGEGVLEGGSYATVSFDLGGSYRNKMVEKQSIINDIIRSFGSTLVLLTIIIIAYFRRLRAIVVILVPLICGVVWAFAVAQAQYGYLNMITAFIFAVLLGLGIDFGIHYLNRYQEVRKSGNSVFEALDAAQRKTGRAIITGSVTTAAAFYALTLADFRGFSQFGFIAGSGVLLCMVSTLLVQPAMLLVSEKFVPIVKQDAGTKEIKLRRLPSPGLIMLVTVVFAGVGIYSAIQSYLGQGDDGWHSDTERCARDDASCIEPHIDFEYNFAKLRTRNNPILNMSKTYGKAMPLSLQPALVIAEDYSDAVRLHDRVMRMRDENEKSTIKVVRSLKTFLPGEMAKKRRVIRSIGELLTDDNLDLLENPDKRKDADRLKRMSEQEPVGVFELPEKVLRTFSIIRPGKENLIPALKRMMADWPGTELGEAFEKEMGKRWKDIDPATAKSLAGQLEDVELSEQRPDADPVLSKLLQWTGRHLGVLAMIYTNVDTWNGIASIRFSKETSTIEQGDRIYRPAGETYIFADTMWAMKKDGIRSIAAALLAVFLILWLDFRSIRRSLLIMTPLFLGLSFLAASMAFLGIKLNFFNMVVFPSLIGIGVDNGVHIFHRYLEEGENSLPKVMATSGWAVGLASLTTMIGFGGMVLANHAGLSSLGELAILGMTCALVASILSFPAILHFLENRRRSS